MENRLTTKQEFPPALQQEEKKRKDSNRENRQRAERQPNNTKIGGDKKAWGNDREDEIISKFYKEIVAQCLRS